MQSRSTPVTSARPGGLAWFGATVVWAGAAVMSFAGLDGLATTCYIAPTISWLLPIVVDVGVAVAAWVWRRGVNPEASRLAGRLTWSLLTLTVVGNGAHLGMEASHVIPPWWVAAVVGAVPPAVAGATAHLLVLLGRVPMSYNTGHDGPERVTSAETRGMTEPPALTSRKTAPTTPRTKHAAPDLRARAAALFDEKPGIGRRQVMVELDVSEHKARKLLEEMRPVNA